MPHHANVSIDTSFSSFIQGQLAMLTDSDKAYWMSNPNHCKDALLSSLALSQIAVEVLLLQGGNNLSRESLLSRGNYDVVSDLAIEFIQSESFRFSSLLEPATIALFSFDHVSSSEEVLEFMKQKGLIAPTEEDLLRLGAYLRNNLENRSVVSLHKDNLWQVPGHMPQVLTLNMVPRQKVLRCIRYENTWKRGINFIARIPDGHPFLQKASQKPSS